MTRYNKAGQQREDTEAFQGKALVLRGLELSERASVKPTGAIRKKMFAIVTAPQHQMCVQLQARRDGQVS